MGEADLTVVEVLVDIPAVDVQEVGDQAEEEDQEAVMIGDPC